MFHAVVSQTQGAKAVDKECLVERAKSFTRSITFNVSSICKANRVHLQ